MELLFDLQYLVIVVKMRLSVKQRKNKDNNTLVKKIKSQKPDIIVITGDLVDRRKYNEESALAFIDKIRSIAPIYYVNGNHEGWSGQFESLEKKLKERGVIVLRNQSLYYEKDKEKLVILGVDDPAFYTSSHSEDYMNEDIIKRELTDINDEKNNTVMVVSRGLGNSIIPQRIFNRPEIVSMTLEAVQN